MHDEGVERECSGGEENARLLEGILQRRDHARKETWTLTVQVGPFQMHSACTGKEVTAYCGDSSGSDCGLSMAKRMVRANSTHRGGGETKYRIPLG